MANPSYESIKGLKKLKSQIKAGAHLNESFELLIEKLVGKYGDNDAVWKSDLTQLSQIHQFLLNELIRDSKLTKDSFDQKFIETTRSFKRLASDSKHHQMLYRMVALNKVQNYVFIGDIHSDPICIYKILSDLDFVANHNTCEAIHLVFTGDYVDRGKNHLETLSVVLLLKYLFSDQVTLLQGNHDGGKRKEDKSIELPYRIPGEDDPMNYFPLFCDELANQNKTFAIALTDLYLDWFSKLPVIASVYQNGSCYLAVHGGLPRPSLTLGQEGAIELEENFYDHIKSLKHFTDEVLKDYLGATIINNMMWSDPDRNGEGLRLDKKRFRFTEKHFDAFVEEFDVDYMIRGHEAHEEGVVSYFGERLYTNFASGLFEHGEVNNTTAYDFVKPHVMVLFEDGRLECVRL